MLLIKEGKLKATRSNRREAKRLIPSCPPRQRCHCGQVPLGPSQPRALLSHSSPCPTAGGPASHPGLQEDPSRKCRAGHNVSLEVCKQPRCDNTLIKPASCKMDPKGFPSHPALRRHQAMKPPSSCTGSCFP